MQIEKHLKYPAVQYTELIREKCFGIYEGKPKGLDKAEAAKMNIPYRMFRGENGESLLDVNKRAAKFLDLLIETCYFKKNNDEITKLCNELKVINKTIFTDEFNKDHDFEDLNNCFAKSKMKEDKDYCAEFLNKNNDNKPNKEEILAKLEKGEKLDKDEKMEFELEKLDVKLENKDKVDTEDKLDVGSLEIKDTANQDFEVKLNHKKDEIDLQSKYTLTPL